MLQATTSRCCGVEGETTTARRCPQRDDCERHQLFIAHGTGDDPAPLWVCETPQLERFLPLACSGAQSNTRHAALARVCLYCQRHDRNATEQRPGFSGSTCASFVPARANSST